MKRTLINWPKRREISHGEQEQGISWLLTRSQRWGLSFDILVDVHWGISKDINGGVMMRSKGKEVECRNKGFVLKSKGKPEWMIWFLQPYDRSSIIQIFNYLTSWADKKIMAR